MTEAANGTSARWHAGCHCTLCRGSQQHSASLGTGPSAEAATSRGQQLLDAAYAGQPFRTVLRDLQLTPNQVWGLTKTDEERSTQLEAALTTTRRGDLAHGTNAAYVAGCVCSECPSHKYLA